MPPPFRLLLLLHRPHTRRRRLLLSSSLPTTLVAVTIMSTSPSPSSKDPPPTYPTHPFNPPPPGSPYPYTPSHFTRLDPSPDSSFYSTPRFVTHIDAPAIARLRRYYHFHLPHTGRILDLCSSWISHFPREMEELAIRSATAGTARSSDGDGERQLEVVGLGMNAHELAANPVLSVRVTHDLNARPEIPDAVGEDLDATVCVVSIDYLTCPVEVLRGVWERTKEGGRVHLVVSNRCFPTKVVGRWLAAGERERLEMVAGYVWWAGWRGVEVVDVVDEEGGKGEEAGVMGRVRGWLGGGNGGGDPLWVVRGVKVGEGEGGSDGHSEM